MRLFISINFNADVKDKIITIENKLKEPALKGNFTRVENLHITLVFLGEVDEKHIKKIELAMNQIAVPPFKLLFNDIGYFKRNGGDIWWLGAEHHSVLFDLQKKLSMDLQALGFPMEQRKYTPHLTLGREVHLNDKFSRMDISNQMESISIDVCKVSLMKSERIKGQLTYTEIYSKDLKGK